MKKISIITLGCKVNQVESENIAETLEKDGYNVVMGLEPADIFIINTCAVTNEAERKSRNYIAKILKLNNNAKIYICGCSSENNPEPFKKGEFVKNIVGNTNKLDLVKAIECDDEDFLNNTHCEYETRVTTRNSCCLVCSKWL